MAIQPYSGTDSPPIIIEASKGTGVETVWTEAVVALKRSCDLFVASSAGEDQYYRYVVLVSNQDDFAAIKKIWVEMTRNICGEASAVGVNTLFLEDCRDIGGGIIQYECCARFDKQKESLEDYQRRMGELYELSLVNSPEDLEAFRNALEQAPLNSWESSDPSEVSRKFFQWLSFTTGLNF